MKKLLLLCLLFAARISAQEVTVLETFDTTQKPQYQQFVFLTDSTDLSQSVKVATIKSIGNIKKPLDLLNAIGKEAHKLGGNSYRVDNFIKGANQTGELTVTAYYTTGGPLSMNFQKLAKNKMYILGDDDLTKPKNQSYRINGEKQEIGAGQYKVYTLKFGEDTKISKGGITGMAIWARYDQNGPRFYSFSGLGVAGGGVGISSSGVNGVSVGITTGSIYPVDANTAVFLMKIYEEKK